MVEVTNITMPMAALIASGIGATATITAALIQLRIAWRKEMQARAEHRPVSKKAKRGPVWAVLLLLVASAVAGFALSQYVVSEGRKNDEVLELELRSRIDQLTLSAQRLENVRLFGKDDLLHQVRAEEAQRLGKQGVVTLVGIDKCVAGKAGESAVCSEQQAMHVELCAELPVMATVSGIDLYVRTEDEGRVWNESRTSVGIDFGGGRFAEKPVERLMGESVKQICHTLNYWNSDSGLQARMVVRYVPTVEADSSGNVRVAEPHTADNG